MLLLQRYFNETGGIRMYEDLKNKVAVITGGSKGIGSAIAKRFG
ncbi:hypothetical protein HMPREF9104_00921 [Lentilactobacillus kisonensis F0435]|uniref:Uncharacterized protein n=1 Tax=Lentilactobacillus kisonensis F0435 TaxID=797516 RepID=H1LE95_9LACO|nr:hypothetical protein HMPREF9104_00921 [Lentilactobacillus kisonensis F0435]